MRASFRLPCVGSSPRVRGKHVSARNRSHMGGLIPACAGKTAASTPANSPKPAHPRVCGENDCLASGRRWWRGSSPRVRGKPSSQSEAGITCRLIPACAGKTIPYCGGRGDLTAHPRVCGENTVSPLNISALAGSSPRVRGKPRGCGAGPPGVGLIPACAGKTLKSRSPARPLRAHPRVCGENHGRGICLPGDGGSSPRVRGKRWKAAP